jgi:hypothetical protein
MAPAVQTTYGENIAEAYAGMVAEPDYQADTRIVETAAGIGYGLAVGRGTGDRGVVLGGALSIFLGITLRDVTQPDAADDLYREAENAGVAYDGVFWAKVATGVTIVPGQVAHYSATTGEWSNTGGSGPVVGAVWESSVVNGVAKLRLTGNRPAVSA